MDCHRFSNRRETVMAVSVPLPALCFVFAATLMPAQQALTTGDSRKVPAKAAAEFRKSQSAFADNKIDKAIRYLLNGIAIDPENAEAYNDLGVIYFNTNESLKAIDAFSSMVKIDPQSFRGYVNLAFLLVSQQRYTESEKAARRAVELRGEDSKARYLLGVSLAFQKKNAAEAEQLLTSAADDVAEARLELSRLLIEKGDFDRGMKELQLFTRQEKLARVTRLSDK